MIRHVAEVATVLTSLTEHCANSYREIGLIRRRPPIRHRRGPFAVADARRLAADWASPAPVVACVGRLVRDMGLHSLMAAAPALLGSSDVRLLIAGADGELRGAAERLAEEWPARAASRRRARVRAALHVCRATLVVAPTLGPGVRQPCLGGGDGGRQAGGGLTGGGHPEYVADGETGLLVPPDDPGLWPVASALCSRDPDRMTRFGLAGRRRVEALFDGDEDQ